MSERKKAMNGRADAPGFMRWFAIPVGVLALILGGCAATAPGTASGGAIGPSVAASPSVAPPAFCPGMTWPPYELEGIPGITAKAIDIGMVEITNGTGRTFYFGIARWYDESTCRRVLASQPDGGPIAAGTTVRAMLADYVDRMDVPITIAFWDKPCGEGCQRAPFAAMSVVRSPVKPGAS